MRKTKKYFSFLHKTLGAIENYLCINDKNYPLLDMAGKPKALLDKTVAEIYGVDTSHINQAVSRNPKRFPENFCFQLTRSEAKSLEKKQMVN